MDKVDPFAALHVDHAVRTGLLAGHVFTAFHAGNRTPFFSLDFFGGNSVKGGDAQYADDHEKKEAE